MRLRSRTIATIAFAIALAVFAFVQDRVTVAGVSAYANRQRAAMEGRSPAVTIDEVMVPAVRRSVRDGAAWSAGVLVAGLAASWRLGRPRTGHP